MRVERLVIEAGESTFVLDLHPRLTVVAGMGKVERESLVAEIVGGLDGSRQGVHVELEERDGRRLAVLRPESGAPRVVDIGLARDVTASFVDEEGRCDLLRLTGLDPAEARRVICFQAEDLVTSTERSRAVERLAGLDQRRVWAAATTLQAAEGDLNDEAGALGTAPQDAALIEEVEARHHAVERAAQRLEDTRRRTFVVAGGAGVVTLPAVVVAGTVGLGFLPIALLAVLASLHARARLSRAIKAEGDALVETGSSTYLGFQLQRVNALLGDDDRRRSLMHAADSRRHALAEWQQLAGDVSVEWAIEHREEIEAASRLRREVDALSSLSSSASEVTSEQTDELAHVLVARLAEARSVGGEGVPLVLDDPFHGVARSVKPMLLELLGRSAGEPQIVILTEDDDIASWARLEALSGDVALVEPSATTDRATARQG